MLFEIINMSDPYTLHADDSKIACAAVIVLGNGHYGMKDETGGDYDTMFLFMPEKDVDEKLAEMFGDFSKYLHDNAQSIAVCLDSVMSCSFSNRRYYDETVKRMNEDERISYRNKCHDENRSSLNDIGGRAWKLATEFRTISYFSKCFVIR